MITFSEFCAVPLDSFLFLRYVVLLTKEAAHMRDTLENLYFGNITPNEQIVKSGTALKKAMEQSAECEEKLAELILQMKAEIAALRSEASTEYPDGVSPKKKAIAAYLRENPGVTNKAKIARDLNMDRTTV